MRNIETEADWESLAGDWAGARFRFYPNNPGSSFPTSTFSHVLVAIVHQAQFLLADIAGRGYCIPSGHIEPGETPEEAARREAYEESGALIQNLQVMGFYRLQTAGIEPPNTESISCAILYLAEPVTLEPLPHGSESRGVRWADLETLPALYHYWSPLMEAVFRYVLEKANDKHKERAQP